MICLEYNKKIIDYDSNVTDQPAGICSCMPRTDDIEKSYTKTVLPTLEHDNEYVLHPEDKPVSSKSTYTIPITGGGIVVRQNMVSSNRYHITGTRNIIDDIAGWSTSKSLMILIIECICQVSLKYRASFKLSKCEFLYERFEYVDHDIMIGGNITAQLKYNSINDRSTSATGDGLHSFMSLCNYYNTFCPMFQLRVIPLRQLYTRYIRKNI